MIRWLRGLTLETAVPVVNGWQPADAEGSVLDLEARYRLPTNYWLEGLDRDGSLDRWGPWKVQAPETANPTWRVLNNPARGPVHLAWDTPLPTGSLLEIFEHSLRE